MVPIGLSQPIAKHSPDWSGWFHHLGVVTRRYKVRHALVCTGPSPQDLMRIWSIWFDGPMIHMRAPHRLRLLFLVQLLFLVHRTQMG